MQMVGGHLETDGRGGPVKGFQLLERHIGKVKMMLSFISLLLLKTFSDNPLIKSTKRWETPHEEGLYPRIRHASTTDGGACTDRAGDTRLVGFWLGADPANHHPGRFRARWLRRPDRAPAIGGGTKHHSCTRHRLEPCGRCGHHRRPGSGRCQAGRLYPLYRWRQ